MKSDFLFLSSQTGPYFSYLLPVTLRLAFSNRPKSVDSFHSSPEDGNRRSCQNSTRRTPIILSDCCV
jgi:hypothetical protein